MAEELKTVETMDREPFKYMVATIGNLPTSFVDSMSYYELLAWLCNYIQTTVIPTVNNNAEAVEELQAKWIELKAFCDDYFTNLNVQNEINNKLDAMAESGELAEIINQEIFTELNGKVDDNTTAIAGLQEDMSALETELLHSRAIVKDSEYDTFSEACSDCLTNGYVLYLTGNQQIPDTGLELPDIIGNGNTITIMNADEDSSTVIPVVVNNKIISNVKFSANSIYARHCLNTVNDGIIERCEFAGFLTPIKVRSTSNTVIRDCVIKNCGKGVWAEYSNNVLIDNITMINTLAQKSAIITLLNNNIAGEDGVLIEDNSKNIKIVNSYFENCVERTLYSIDSNDVVFSNNIMENTNGVKFVGSDNGISKGFVCEGNLLRNSISDAFCQLYEVEGCQVNNNIIINDTDSNYLGWFVRAGHTFSNISIKGNYAKRIRRCFLAYEDTFPDTMLTTNFAFNNVNIEDNTGMRMMMINQPLYGAIDYSQSDQVSTHSGSQVSIRNNTFYATQWRGDSTFVEAGKNSVFATGIKLSNIDRLVIENNDIRGIVSDNKVLPAVDLTSCSNVYINESYSHNESITNITFITPTSVVGGNIKVNCHATNHDDKMDLAISGKGVLTGEFSTAFVNKEMYIPIPKAWDINLDIMNVDEISKVFSIGGTPYTIGDRTSTTNISTTNVVCLYEDGNNNVLRCRTTRNLSANGIVSIYTS